MMNNNWLLIDNSLLIYKSELDINKDYLLFDLDYTIIKPKGKNKFPKDKNDWMYIFNSKEKIIEEYNNNKNIIIFSNQSKLNSEDKINEFKEKIENIIKDLNINIQIYISLKEDKYRKPLWFMFYKMLELNNIKNLDKSKCLYIGDAGGREKDFSSDDRLFAYNIGINYKTPEEYFLNENPLSYKIDCFTFDDLKNYENNKFKKSSKQELIILVGYPGCGKSYFCKKYLKDYIHINQDELKTLSKCKLLTIKSLKEKKSIVIDNTNPSKDTRKIYIDICKELNIPCRCIYFDLDLKIIKHLNIYRELLGEKKRIPNIAYNVYNKKFNMPIREEGFEDIIIWHLNLEFKNENDKELFYKYY